MNDTVDQEPPSTPPRAVDPAVPALEQRLGVALPDAALALAALTHKSYVNEHRGEALSDNERLEFLGDAVIDLAVSHRLMERFPEAREGDLSKIRAAVVDEPGLASIAREIDLGPLLRLGRGEELTGGRQKSSLLADALEAVIAVVYVNGGLAPVLALVDRFLGEAFARAAEGTLDRDYKTQLQEVAQSRFRATPRYRVVAERGPDHSKTFDVELELRGEVVGRGEGRSKKDAEQAAARVALAALRADASGSRGEPITGGADAVAHAAAAAPAEPSPQAVLPAPSAPEESGVEPPAPTEQVAETEPEPPAGADARAPRDTTPRPRSPRRAPASGRATPRAAKKEGARKHGATAVAKPRTARKPAAAHGGKKSAPAARKRGAGRKPARRE